MRRTAKPKSQKLQQQERLQDILMELTGYTSDAREALYNYCESLSTKSKKRIFVISKLYGEIQTLEKFIDDIGFEIVFQRAETIIEEAKNLSNKITEEINDIKK
nr:MAG TPA: hypothetical protein [Caudoviricetes sp.]